MSIRSKLPGVKIYKSFEDFVKDLTHALEKDHNFVHSEHKRKLKEMASKIHLKG